MLESSGTTPGPPDVEVSAVLEEEEDLSSDPPSTAAFLPSNIACMMGLVATSVCLSVCDALNCG